MEKSKIQLAKEKCENLLKFFTEKQVEVKFQSVKVKDSDVILEFPELVKGADVTTSSPTGSVAATDGDYTLSDGTEITVKDSKIDKIVAKPDDAPEDVKPEDKPADEKLADAPVEDAPTEDVKPDDKGLSDLTDRVSQLEDAIKSILEAISGSPTKEDIQDFNSKIEQLAKIPTQLSADNRVEIKESELDKYRRIANSFQK